MDRAPSPYRPDIDGLRAIAVMAVVIYHGFPAVLPGGFVGVDVFFVISGYLISGHIAEGLAAGRFGFADFYGRRVRRIFPALVLVLGCALAYGFVVLLPAELAALGGDAVAGAGFAANVRLWMEAGYFDRAASAKPLLHLWSLGVEEQFYIVWPLVLWGLHRARLRRRVVMIGLAGLSLAASIGLTWAYPTADFYAPFTRFWELLAGAALAENELGGRVWPRADITAIAGLVIILAAAGAFNGQMHYPGWLALLPVGGATLLIAAGPGGWVNRRVLASPPARFIGRISYPLYLWHWPLLCYAGILYNGRPLKVFLVLCLIGTAILLAWGTTDLVERPLRFGAHKAAKTAALLGAMGLMAVAGGITWQQNGFPGRFASLPDVNISKINAAIHDGIFKLTAHMRVTVADKIYTTQIGAGGEAVLFTGDSVLFQYGPRVEALYQQGKLGKTVYFTAGASCAPVPGISKPGVFAYCSALPGVTARLIAARRIHTVVIGAFWQGYYPGHDVYVQRGSAPPVLISSTAGVDAFFANLQDEITAWRQAGLIVYVILAAPADPGFDPQTMVTRHWNGISLSPRLAQGLPMATLTSETADANRRLRALSGATLLDPAPDICGTGAFCPLFFGEGEPKFADLMHLRPAFVARHMQFLDEILRK